MMQQDYSRAALYHPELLPVFRAHQAHWQFDAHCQGLSMVNAWWLCNFAQLAYYPEQRLRAELSKMQMQCLAYIDNSSTATQGFIAANRSFIILAFRGTQAREKQDLVTDLQFLPEPLQSNHLHAFTDEGKVHSGFVKAFSSVWGEQVKPVITAPEQRQKPLWISGHSLGAALATLAAVCNTPQGLYTFGSPRVGDSDFCRLLAAVNHQRFVNCCDVVTTVPPRELFGYSHSGVLRYFADDNQLHVTPENGFILRDRVSANIRYALKPVNFKEVLFRSLVDHSIVNYALNIRRQLE